MIIMTVEVVLLLPSTQLYHHFMHSLDETLKSTVRSTESIFFSYQLAENTPNLSFMPQNEPGSI